MSAMRSKNGVTAIAALGAVGLIGALASCGSSASNSVDTPAGQQSAAAQSQASASPAGSLNPKFNQTGTGFNQPVDAVAANAADDSTTNSDDESEDTLVVGGRFTAYNGDARNYVAQLNANGSLDKDFVPTGKGLNGRVRAVATAEDGKVLVGGEFTAYDSTPLTYLAQLNADGSLDKEFTPPKLSKPVWGITVQPDDKILIGGLFAKSADTPGYVARLNANGSADKTFVGAGLNGYVKSSAVQQDGKIIIGGSFTSPRVNIARLNTDGTLDASFDTAKTGLTPDGYVDKIIIQDGGKIAIGGWFTAYSGTPVPRVARLQSDGTLDPTFAATGTGLNAPVKTMALQKDGKFMVGGDFTAYDSTPVQSVARLNSNGSLDTSFVQTGKGLNGNVNELALTSDGNVAIGGAFSAYDTTAISNIAELLGAAGPSAPSAPQQVTAIAGAKGSVSVAWQPPADAGSSAITKYTATAISNGQKTQTCSISDPKVLTCTMSGLKAGPQYSVTVTATNSVGTGPASAPPAKVTPK